MRPIELLRVVWVNMNQNKFRVFTTSLGVIAGAITIVLVIAIGQGGEQQAAKGFSGLSADTVYINLNDQNVGFDTKNVERLTPELLEHVLEENTALSGIYLRNITHKQVSVGKEKEQVYVSGVTENYGEISNLHFESGVDFSKEDMEAGNRTVVLGAALAEKFFGNAESSVGKKVKIGGKFYKVVGVLKSSKDGLQGLNPDDTVFVPYEAMQNKEELLDEYALPQAVGKAKSLDLVKTAMEQMQSTLDFYLQNSNTYLLEDAGSRIDAATESARTMKMLLISVAAIVFVVGGIGIMNVLFVTVKERTKEIGVLKALGSTKGDILMQFFLESLSIGVFSGLAGVVLSIFALYLMGHTNIPVVPSFVGMAVAFGFSVLTSGVFGFYPAYKAAGLKPVDALNYE